MDMNPATAALYTCLLFILVIGIYLIITSKDKQDILLKSTSPDFYYYECKSLNAAMAVYRKCMSCTYKHTSTQKVWVEDGMINMDGYICPVCEKPAIFNMKTN